MDNEQQNIINDLQQQIVDLKSAFFRGNFSNGQDISKYTRFNSRLQVPVPSALATKCEVGEICAVSGKLYICSAANTWTVAGTQS